MKAASCFLTIRSRLWITFCSYLRSDRRGSIGNRVSSDLAFTAGNRLLQIVFAPVHPPSRLARSARTN